MAPISILSKISLVVGLAALAVKPSLVLADTCGGFGDLSALGNSGQECFVDPSTGSDLEMGLLYMGDCAQVTIIASAVFTGTDNIVSTVPSYAQETPPALPANDVGFVYFPFTVPYSNIQNNSPVTWIRNYVQGGQTGHIGNGVSTLHLTPTLAYAVETYTVLSTTEVTQSTTSYSTETSAVTVTPHTTITLPTTAATQTLTVQVKPITITLTISPSPKTLTKTIVSKTTTTLTCLPAATPLSKRYSLRGHLPPSASDMAAGLVDRQPVGIPEALNCGAVTTSTIVTSATATTSTVVQTETQVFVLPTTTTTTITAATPIANHAVTARTTITASPLTITRTTTARASKTTTTTTVTRTVTKLPLGGRTPKCPVVPQPIPKGSSPIQLTPIGML